MFSDVLPCAEPVCKDKMRLVFKNDRYVGYRCLLKPNSHNFRYDLERKRWEKIIITTKPILGYKQSPHEVLYGEEHSIETV